MKTKKFLSGTNSARHCNGGNSNYRSSKWVLRCFKSRRNLVEIFVNDGLICKGRGHFGETAAIRPQTKRRNMAEIVLQRGVRVI